ncbi:hypothetical protein PAQ31011_02416 [Pandoraea aquatica]|uniref:SF3 helicase domain-containing protein n=1 Tax=Pandoraea aquatica TaxID=2508290 RepID=A0A5E4V286_9BURK|nr:phage/plasmid primase, P4 family [Pandoraea aquatica]VVE06392.1 hypothetical protein PAQ31011_02416 [Pandoraea aquatica]
MKNHLQKFTELAAEGLASIPIRSNSKIPLTDHGFKDASLDLATHSVWAEKFRDSNIAYATGAISGRLLVVDIDVKNGKDGMQSLVQIESEHGSLPKTRIARTPSGGSHMLFYYPEGVTVANKVDLRPGIDIRAEGGYCVAPPSRLENGLYAWEDKLVPIADAPVWLIDLIRAPSKKRETIARGETYATGSRNHNVMLHAFALLNRGLDYGRLQDELIDFNIAFCRPPLAESEVAKVAASVIKSHKKSGTVMKDLTDLGNARRLSQLFGDELRFHSDSGQWLEKQPSGLWKRVDTLWVQQLARALIDLIYEEAEALGGNAQSAMSKHAYRSQSSKAMKDAIELFKSEPNIAVSTEQLDQGEWLFPTKNGIVDLRTGEFMPIRPELHITYTAGVEYDEHATCPTWEKFLLQIMAGDTKLVEYLRRAIGYSLTAQITEHCLFFLYGSGANGKSTFLNVLRALFGDLGSQANGDMLLEKSGSHGFSQNAASSEVARLVGKRFVAMSEVEEGRHFSEKTVKWYTGGEMITARFLYQNFFEFKPRFKLWLAGNHKPTVKGADHGIWRRLRLIPFTVTVPVEQRDPDLERKLCEELPGILNWALEGCRQWQANGHRLQDPEVISNEVTDYRGEMDIVGSWLNEFTCDDPEGEIRFTETFKFFKWWSSQQFNFSYSGKRFGTALKDKGYIPLAKPDRVYKGLRLLVDLDFNEHTGAFVGYRHIENKMKHALPVEAELTTTLTH